ncbi:hypothetical protein AB0O28_21710 [Microbispora sp. NPDC088329]|uniref:hypothetical protein n=1 Tax=Microbispora sp. NPDC088329 TaxID=3154869 RepID=UPI003413D6A5
MRVRSSASGARASLVTGTFGHFSESTVSAERIMRAVFGHGVLCIVPANLALAIILAFQRVHAAPLTNYAFPT